MAEPPAKQDAENSNDVRARILDTASRLFYEQGVRAVGVDLVTAKAGVAKTSIYRHFRTKDALVAAFLEREDAAFWASWDEVAAHHADDPAGELRAHFAWIAERLRRPNYRGCPQVNVAAEFADADHPARRIARDHKVELRRRFKAIAEGMDIASPDSLAAQLTLLANGAFVSAQLLAAGEAEPVLQDAVAALVAAARAR